MEKQEYLNLYHQMVVIRLLEEKVAELYQQGKIGGFLHLYIGQEAVSTGLISTRRPEDRVITAYRDHGVAINCGLPAGGIIAEMLGKATGVSGGKGGSMHLADVEKNFWGGHAIVGAHLPLAAGLALGDQYQGNAAVTICMFGDGATNIGFFHEALNLSKVWNLPVLWVCENNQYGMGTAVERASAVSEIRRKADGYGMKNAVADGMNLMDVREVAGKMMEEIRAGGGPQFLEIMTYRFRGHSMGDPERYRKPDEIRKWEENDPIGIYRKYLVDHQIASEDELNAQDQSAEKEIAEAVEFAENSPEPAAEELFKHIYVEE
ncbi:pyruvate dehydrogenase (acetyl-transferring) E1 component subunit alpha [Levilinea saccharolytica]|uniref:Pyruvate dehydrogenase E1 component subunit alpha n=1 Tax=Levilinea saccharolytica TaxID=229921 RepID=A0A0N0RD07_9CHLR|nr:pyruvate dehydrogenase (acetyl-transferring) E1 component subunit alpha [Levilinea saccharolytica]KPL76226.1 pyruvate dehydrogenase [Levilinea saccharolytica]GAP19004.1 pyruvate dehydrogenase E1 component, alpha subunit [Levilinea saccharolytica]